MQLDVRGLSLNWHGKSILQDINFQAASGEMIGLVGPNGAGKTSLLSSLAGLLPAEGVMEYDHRSMASLKGYDKAALFSYMPQEREINWALSCERIVALGIEACRPSWSGLDDDEKSRIEAAMVAMRLTGFSERNAQSLSGGEKARLLMARLLVQESAVLLADEPGAGLDPAHQFIMMQQLAHYAKKDRLVIVSMHDLNMAARWCTRLILMDKGRIIADDTPVNVLTAARLKQIYHIEADVQQTPHGVYIEMINVSEDWS